MTTPYIRKIMRDKKNYVESKIADTEHIYCKFNDENISNIRAMIVGPDDTSYEGGFYFIYITLPKEYPFKSPQAKYCTQYNNFRFHPNLYVNGKMCLSILDNQWSGPPWIPSMGINTLLLTTRSILDDNPLANEPGYSKGKILPNNNHDKYRNLVRYMNIVGATIHTIKHPPQGFEDFQPEMMNYFINNYDKYINFINKKLKSYDNKQISMTSYIRCSIDVDINKLIIDMENTLNFCKNKLNNKKYFLKITKL